MIRRVRTVASPAGVRKYTAPAGGPWYSARMARAYEEIANFIASEIRPDSLIAFQPSDAAKQRVEDLIRREKNKGLTPEETSELNEYLVECPLNNFTD